MNISYSKVNNEILKLVQGLGFKVRMFDADGTGPISSPKLARYIEVRPDGMMISLPSGETSDFNEIIVYKNQNLDLDKFKNFYKRLKNVAKFHGLGVTVRSFGHKIEPKDLAHQARATKEESQVEESSIVKSFKSLESYLKNKK